MLNFCQGKFAENEGEYWQKLTEGEVSDLDLFTACAIGDFDYVRTYIEKVKYHLSSDINKKNTGGWTPLMYVCFLGYDKILELLIREGADILSREEKRGTTPLMLASSSGNTSVVKRLVEEGAGVNTVDKNGRTALFHATVQGHLNVVKFLLRNDADALISENVSGYTPFMEAARQGNEFVFNHFLEYGIDLDLPCKTGLTCRDLAYQNDKMVIVNMIDNFCMKRTSSSLRDEPDLGCPDFVVEDVQQSQQKVHKWLNEHNPGFFSEPKSVGDVEKPKFMITRGSFPVSNEPGFTSPYSTSDFYGMSYGTETLVDSDRTPVGTPVESILQQYMANEVRQFGRQFSSDNMPSLASFLEKLHLEKYQQVFDAESVDFRILTSLTEEDFKDLGLKLGPRRKLKSAIQKWKLESGLPSGSQSGGQEVINLKRQLADVAAKLQRVTSDFVCEKEARSSIEAENMEERARRNHMYFIAEKVQRSCQELQNCSKNIRDLAKSLETCVALAIPEDTGEDLHSKLKTLQAQMNDEVQNTDNAVETILRRVRKMMCDDLTGLSSDSDSPESSCTSISKSESSIPYSH